MALTFRNASLASTLRTPSNQGATSISHSMAQSASLPTQMWIGVRQRFAQCDASLNLTPLQRIDGDGKRNGVVNCLNRHYYHAVSETDHSFLIGAWAKGTTVRPPRDVDLYFVLPPSVFHRLQSYVWNRQSALLQEVKTVLAQTYPATDMSGDGRVVLVRFASYNVEVVPAFELQTGGY